MYRLYKQLAQFQWFPQYKNLPDMIKQLHKTLLKTFIITPNLLKAFNIIFWQNVERYCTLQKLLGEIDKKNMIKRVLRNILH